MNSDEVVGMLVFNRVTNYTPAQKLSLYKRFKSAAEILKNRKEAEAIFQKQFMINGEELAVDELQQSVDRELKFYEENLIHILDINSNKYPDRLRNIDDPPLVIFTQGRVDLLNEGNPIAMVGARRASNMSINMAYSIARDLTLEDSVVVSGLASGIDYYAHKGALDGGGETIAVLGNGIDVVYPRSNRDMYESIRARGLLISEFSVGTPPLKYNFPKRNRIISGLSLGTLVVEASAKSGALITANYALEQGREVMALPGRAGSESFTGNNRLIKEGAHLVEDASDVMEILGFSCEFRKKNKKLPFSPLECNILSIIGDEKVSIEEIERILEDPVSKITSALTMLELKGSVIQYPGKIFSRVDGYGKE